MPYAVDDPNFYVRNVKYVYDLFPLFDAKDARGNPYQWVMGKVDPSYFDGDTIYIVPSHGDKCVKSPGFKMQPQYDIVDGKELFKIRFAGINTFETSDHKTERDIQSQKTYLASHYIPDTEANLAMSYEVGDETKDVMKYILSVHGWYAFALIDTFDSYPNGPSDPGRDKYHRLIGKVYLFNTIPSLAEDEGQASNDKSKLILHSSKDGSGNSIATQVMLYTPGATTPYATHYDSEFYLGNKLESYIRANPDDGAKEIYSQYASIEDIPENTVWSYVLVEGIQELLAKTSVELMGDQSDSTSLPLMLTAWLQQHFEDGDAFYKDVNTIKVDSSQIGSAQYESEVLVHLSLKMGTYLSVDNKLTKSGVTPAEAWETAASFFVSTGKNKVTIDDRLQVRCLNLTMINTYSTKHPELQLAHLDYRLVRNTGAYIHVSPSDYNSVASSFPLLAWAKYETDIAYKTQDDSTPVTNTKFENLFNSFTQGNWYMDKSGHLYQATGVANHQASASKEGLAVQLQKLDDNGKLIDGEFYSPPDNICSNLNPLPCLEDDVGNPLLAAQRRPDETTSEYDLIIGDVKMIVPPISINIQEQSQTSRVQTLRTKSSMQIQSGYTDCRISIDLFFNDIEGINGLEIPNPFMQMTDSTSSGRAAVQDASGMGWTEPYAIDGLRTLIAQFKKTPFLPIQNELIEAYGVFNVALESMTISTVPNFPNTMVATLNLIPFNLTPFMPKVDDLYTKINWPIFRWYVQSSLQKKHSTSRTYLKPINGRMKHDVRFKIVDENDLRSQVEAMAKLRRMTNVPVFKDSNSEAANIDSDYSAINTCLEQKKRLEAFFTGCTPDEKMILNWCRGNISTYQTLMKVSMGDSNYPIFDRDLTWFYEEHNKIVNDPDRIKKMRIYVAKNTDVLSDILSHAPDFTVMDVLTSGLWRTLKTMSAVIVVGIAALIDLISANEEELSDTALTDPGRIFVFKKLLLIDIMDSLIHKMEMQTYMNEEPALALNYYYSGSRFVEDNLVSNMIYGMIQQSKYNAVYSSMRIDWEEFGNSADTSAVDKLNNGIKTGADYVFGINFKSNLLLSQVGSPGDHEVQDARTTASQTVVNITDILVNFVDDKSILQDDPKKTQRLIFKEDSIEIIKKILEPSSGSTLEYEKMYYDILTRAKMDEEDVNMIYCDSINESLKDLVIQGISCEMKNIYSSIQLDDQDSPTLQFFGSQDNTYTVSAVTDNRETLKALERLFSEARRLSREYRISINSGFLEIENDIINLTGTTAIVPESLDVSTMASYPELLSIKMVFTAFDKTQKRRETPQQMQLHADSPFRYKSDWISYINARSKNEESQLIAFEHKLQDQEVYPDMELPTWDEFAAALPYLNCGIKDIKEYDSLFGDLGPNRGKYVDPDFYVSCTETPRVIAIDETILATERDKRARAMRLIDATGSKKIEIEPIGGALVLDGTTNKKFDETDSAANSGYDFIRSLASKPNDNDTTVTSSGIPGGLSKLDDPTVNPTGVQITNGTDYTMTGAMPVGQYTSYNIKAPYPRIEDIKKIPDVDTLIAWGLYPEQARKDITALYQNKDYKSIFKNPSIDTVYAFVLQTVKEVFRYPSGTAAPADDVTLTTFVYNGKTVTTCSPSKISYEKLARAICATLYYESNLVQYWYDTTIDSYDENTKKRTPYENVPVIPVYARNTGDGTSHAIGMGQMRANCGSLGSLADYYRAGWDWKFNVTRMINRWAQCFNLAYRNTASVSDARDEAAARSASESAKRRSFVLELADTYYNMVGKRTVDTMVEGSRMNKFVSAYQSICRRLGTSTVTTTTTGTSSVDTDFGFPSEDVMQMAMAQGEVVPLILSKEAKAGDKYEFLAMIAAPLNIRTVDKDSAAVVQNTYAYGGRWLSTVALNKAPADNPDTYQRRLAEVQFIRMNDEEYKAVLGYASTYSNDAYTVLNHAIEQEKSEIRVVRGSGYSSILEMPNKNSWLDHEWRQYAYWHDTVPHDAGLAEIPIVGFKQFIAAAPLAFQSISYRDLDEMMDIISGKAVAAAVAAMKKRPGLKPWEMALHMNVSAIELTSGATHTEIANLVTFDVEPIRRDDLQKIIATDLTGVGGEGDQKTELEEVLDASNTALTDFMTYSHHGRLLRAFPTFQMFIIDEGQWKLYYKMWDNLYGFNAIQSIEVIKDKRMAADTAIITMTNLYSNLTTKDNLNRGADWEFSIVNAVFKGDWTRMWTALTNDVDQAVFESRQEVLDSLMLRAGARIHLRMGYGSNAESLPIAFNGTITEISPPGEMIQIVAQGDGLELTNRIPARKNDTNDSGALNWIQLPDDPVLTLLETMTSSGSFWQDVIGKLFEGFGVHGNPLGIEHFGMSNTVPSDLLTPASFRMSAHKKDYGELGINIHDLSGKRITSGWVLSSVPLEYLNDPSAENAVDGKNPIAYLTNMPTSYDSKNRPKVYLYDKSVWDLCQLLAVCLPDFVTAVVPFGLRSTLFFGKPYYALAYDYDYVYKMDTVLKKITAIPAHIYRKSFEQFHMVSSTTDIISNKIMATSEGMATNVIITYGGQAGHKSVEAPLVSMDTDIRAEYQKTANHYLDLAPSQITEGWGDFWCSQNMALTAGANILKEYAGGMYDGELLVLGIPSLKPQDTIALKDTYSDMTGMVGTRRVIHHMSLETGFTTSITPHCLSVNDDTHMIQWRLWQGTAYSHIAAHLIVDTIPYLMLNRWKRILLNRAILRGKPAEIIKAQKYVLTNIVDHIFGYGENAQKIRKIINSTLGFRPGIDIPATLANFDLADNKFMKAPITKCLEQIKALDNSAAEKLLTLDQKKLSAFTKIVEEIGNASSPKKNVQAMFGMLQALRSDDIGTVLKNQENLAAFFTKLDDIVDALTIIEQNADAFKDAQFVVGDVAQIKTNVKSLKAIITTGRVGDKAIDAERITTEVTKVLKGLPKALQVANGVEDAEKIASALNTVRRTGRLVSLVSNIKHLATVVRALSIAGGVVGIVVEVAIDATITILTNMVVEMYRRYLKNRQAITIIPIKYRGKILTAGIGGHRGAVLGDAPSTLDQFFYADEGASIPILGLNGIGVEWLNKMLFTDDQYKNPFTNQPDPYAWLNETETLGGDTTPEDATDNDSQGDDN